MVFYFTATGNSKYVADKIVSTTGEQAINIADCIKNNQYSFEIKSDESVGIVVPIYYYGIPMIATEFLSKLKIQSKASNYYTYAVLNCGGSTGDSARFIKNFIKPDAVYGVKMIDNYVPMFKQDSKEAIEKKLDEAEQALDKIATLINAKATGTYNPVVGQFPHLLTPIVYLMYKKGRKTKKFKVSDKYNGCGLCEEICPRKIIDCSSKKPVWTVHQCEECLACLHRCPTAAIDYGKSAGRGRYINPRVEL